MDGGWADLHAWRIERDSAEPLFRQIYGQIRGSIQARALASGARLPSTRALAGRLGVSRTSAIVAYEQLIAEGWLTSRRGSGAYVCEDLPEPFAAAPAPASSAAYAPNPEELFGPLAPADEIPGERPFTMGLAMIEARTADAWRRATHRTVRNLAPCHFGYTDPRGLPELRAAICGYLRAARAVRCEPDQVIVTSGTQHAIDLAVRVLLQPGEGVWVEDPSYPMTVRGLTGAGLELHPVPVDGQGIDVAAGVRLAPLARAAVVTPSHQYPTGAVLSMARRLELLAWARQADAFVIEDDYDSELRYKGRPLASLQGLDEAERVIYVGTLNKALFPGLRIGYAVVPRGLLARFINARHISDRQAPTLSQSVLADFMAGGHLTTHFRRLRQLYRQAQDVLVAALTAEVPPGRLDIRRPDQGNHLMVWLPQGTDDVALERAARAEGVVCRAVSRLYLAAPPRSGVMLGFTGFRPEALNAPAARLGALIAQRLPAARAAKRNVLKSPE
jgi:GntR family transcriptional regulator/MocR family aminotransferase